MPKFDKLKIEDLV
jgi:hypothetical protein